MSQSNSLLAVQRHRIERSPSRDLSLNHGFGDAPQEPYIHTPLPTSTSIRLITWGKEFVTTKDLRFSFRVIDLATTDRPPYTTISYSWGSGPSSDLEDIGVLNNLLTNTVVCDGRYLRVTENAYAALAELRWRGRAHSFWLDAVCIDQSDLEERAHQVAMMGDIYAMAERTIVWLGEDDDASHQARDIIQDASAHLDSPNQRYQLQTTLWVESNVDEFLELNLQAFFQLRANIALPREAMDLLKFFARSWFQRLWIVQEVVLAKHLWILCGQLMFDWQAMVDLAHDRRLYELLSTVEDDELVARGVQGLSMVRLITFLRGDETSFQKMANSMFNPGNEAGQFCAVVSTLIDLFDNCSLSDCRDRIYAPLALAARLSPTKPSILFSPNYVQSVEEIFTGAAKYFVRETLSLNVLTMSKTANPKTSSSMPSWVPDFRIRSSQKAISTLCLSDATKDWTVQALPASDNSPLLDIDNSLSGAVSQSGNSQAPLVSSCSIRGSRLEVRGVQLDTTSRTSQCVADVLDQGGLMAVLTFLQDSREWQERRSTMPELLLKCLTFEATRSETYATSMHPSADSFLSWFSFQLLSAYHMSRLSHSDLMDLSQWLSDGDRGFCKKHTAISVPGHGPGRSKCDICHIGEQKFLEMSNGELDMLARVRKSQRRISLGTVIRHVNILAYLVERHRSGHNLLGKLAGRWLDAHTYQAACKPYTTDRSLFLTEKGRLGMCPRTGKPGDQVWFLQGAKTPVILRPVSDCDYELVGEAYLDGYMHGEICNEYTIEQLVPVLLR